MSILGNNKELWVTKAGEVVDVDSMNENHAKNTLKMLIRQIREGKLTNLGFHQERINSALAEKMIDKAFEDHKEQQLRQLNRTVQALIRE